MGTYYTNAIYASRILSATSPFSSISDADDGDVTNWDPATNFVLEVILYCSSGTGRNPVAGTYQLQWRDATDLEEIYGNISSSGEMIYTSATDLSDGSTISTPACGTPAGYSYTSGISYQIEDGLSPSIDPAAGNCFALRFGISPASAQWEHEYVFNIYDPTNSLDLGVVAASITMKSQPTGLMIMLWQEHNPI